MNNRPALKASCILAAGILLGKWIPLRSAWLFWATLPFIGLAAASIRMSRFRRAAQGLLAALLLLTGAFRYVQENRLFPPNHIVRFIRPGRFVILRGVLEKDPVLKIGRSEILIQTLSVEFNDTVYSACGKVLIPFYRVSLPPLKYGDEISVSGKLNRPAGKRNPGGFDYREYLSRQNIHAMLKRGSMDFLRILHRGGGNVFLRRFLYPVRRFAQSVIDATVQDPDGRALLNALVLGDQGMVTPELREDFSKTGVVHILSVSGSHVGFMYMILFMAFGFLRLPDAFKTAAIVAGLVFYAQLTEASPPVVRAVIMALAALAGTRIERKADPYNILGVAAFAILLWMPQDLFDPGFQLSFLSVFSIVYIYQKFKNLKPVSAAYQKLSRYSWAKTTLAAVLVSLAAQIGTAPVSAAYFNWIPLSSIPANLIAIPLSGLIIAVSFTCLIIAPIHSGIASVYGALNGLLLSAFIRILDWIEKLPYSCVTVPSPRRVADDPSFFNAVSRS
jgi:competence protein ComEC